MVLYYICTKCLSDHTHRVCAPCLQKSNVKLIECSGASPVCACVPVCLCSSSSISIYTIKLYIRGAFSSIRARNSRAHSHVGAAISVPLHADYSLALVATHRFAISVPRRFPPPGMISAAHNQTKIINPHIQAHMLATPRTSNVAERRHTRSRLIQSRTEEKKRTSHRLRSRATAQINNAHAKVYRSCVCVVKRRSHAVCII